MNSRRTDKTLKRPPSQLEASLNKKKLRFKQIRICKPEIVIKKETSPRNEYFPYTIPDLSKNIQSLNASMATFEMINKETDLLIASFEEVKTTLKTYDENLSCFKESSKLCIELEGRINPDSEFVKDNLEKQSELLAKISLLQSENKNFLDKLQHDEILNSHYRDKIEAMTICKRQQENQLELLKSSAEFKKLKILELQQGCESPKVKTVFFKNYQLI